MRDKPVKMILVFCFVHIILQPVISKIYSAILTNRLSNWSNVNNVIGEEQAGFRSSYSTIDNLFCL